MRNIVWNIKFINVVFEKIQTLIPRNHIYIYMRNIVWNIDFSKNLKHF